jgi:hypothetical protein
MSDLPSPPPPPAYQPPAFYQEPPGYLPPPISPAARGALVGAGLLSQFGGYAAWSIGIGLVAIVVPIVTNYYFPLLPIIGGLNALRAIQRGRVIGGVVGLGVNAVAGLLALILWRLSS